MRTNELNNSIKKIVIEKDGDTSCIEYYSKGIAIKARVYSEGLFNRIKWFSILGKESIVLFTMESL